MDAKLIVTYCGCAVIAYIEPYKLIIDSDLLPSYDIHTYAVMFDDHIYLINKIFNSWTAIVNYLNTAFKTENNLEEIVTGTFSVRRGGIYYYNIEKYQKIEFMAILQTYMRIFKVGSPETIEPGYVVNKPYVSVPNSDTITHDYLKEEVELVFVANGLSEPVTSKGHLHNKVDGTLKWPNQIEDTYVYVVTKQTAFL